jgi:cardiolipin synthase C
MHDLIQKRIRVLVGLMLKSYYSLNLFWGFNLKFFLIISLLLISSISHGEAIYFLKNGIESLSARSELLSEARKNISFLTYEFDPCDSSTKIILDLMISKAKQGVSVEIVIDNQPNSRDKIVNLAAYLKPFKIKVKTYNNANIILLAKNYRNHVKLIVVDSTGYIIGGRNSRDDYFGLSSNMNYIDQDVLVYGPSTQISSKGFARIANAATTVYTLSAPAKNFYNQCLSKTERDLDVADHIMQFPFDEKVTRHACDEVSLEIDDPVFIGKAQSLQNLETLTLNDAILKYKSSTKLFLDFVSGTQNTLVMENQYYLPEHKLKEAFKVLRTSKTPPRITIYSNKTSDGFGSIDKPFTALMTEQAYIDSKHGQKNYLMSSLGIMNNRHELTPTKAKWRIHTKSGVRDSKDVLISSFNIDPRSYHTNLEAVFVVKNCPTLAYEVESDIQRLYISYLIDQIFCQSCADELKNLKSSDVSKAIAVKEFL